MEKTETSDVIYKERAYQMVLAKMQKDVFTAQVKFLDKSLSIFF